MTDKKVDILIVGGGLTGATLMLALAAKGFNTVLIDASRLSDKINADFDARSLALSPASVRILEMLNVWPLLRRNATAIHSIQVSDQHHFGATRLEGKPSNPLGYVVEIQYINQAIHQLLPHTAVLAPVQLQALDKENSVATISTATGTVNIHAQLIVAADGSESAVRRLLNLSAKKKDYGQQAIVANIGLARSHHNCAYERFTASGPLALLPMTENRASLVWAVAPEEAKRLLNLSEKEFLNTLQQAFGYRLGRLVRVGQRMIFPLRQVVMSKQGVWPFVFVGNAAHTLHPVAGQGFNLGLRDVAALAQCIIQRGLNPSMLQHYELMRQHDQRSIVNLTDGLIKIFTSRLPGLSLARNLGLIAVDNLPFLKRSLAYYARGFAGITPDLVCGIELDTGEVI
ncbi:2-octaprenyl-6-methoxyphenyl hydroxylase [Legionella hackeliae]|uniref:2-octaprenyl-6-methoxyphenol hydroxylase n=1 Tax=Legionella hackeliae TaxID=449 RepID=A0A0A8UKF9_LEGHA|nr:2-octaprenyl-6-methoxyphenyl hydroxylase [Legionella hackeliae]KTD12875.1 2-octaprenyl-6-methoxyphenol hydroxylase [Legionella hackeliae]CEK09183.1 2-octaprenyl-6-methoxyphenol hydroxylase [Legionella hackeliae]STX49091.1 2-octaprenyl-6-methoxyphenol hydroxylase [Legionella hackeliae]